MPKATLRATVRCGKRAPSWGTYPMCRSSGATWRWSSSAAFPAIDTRPRSARSNPAITRSRVVLPLPEAPKMAANDPSGTESVSPVSTGWAPKAL